MSNILNLPYFAYGSNLNPSKYNQGRLQLVGPATLPDHDLAFNYNSSSWQAGALNLVPQPGCRVHGALFEADAAGWDWLDRKEGHPNCYRRVPVTVNTSQGLVESTTYIVIREKEKSIEIPPQPEYVRLVSEGLTLLGQPVHGLEAAVARAADDGPSAIFVYGTLMRGQCRHSALGHPECILQAFAPGRLFDLGSYPGMLPPVLRSDWVQGEFVRVADIRSTLALLDRIEGYVGPYRVGESLYRRERVQVDVGDGRFRGAWTYYYNHPAEKRISSDNWRKHLGVWESFLRKLASEHCGAQEREIAWRVAGQIPFSFNPDRKAVAEDLVPIWKALDRETLSERRLAQETERWAVGW